jgi:hypothetical protein
MGASVKEMAAIIAKAVVYQQFFWRTLLSSPDRVR